MKLNMTGRQMTVRDSLRELVERKLQKFDRYFGEDTTAYVTVSTSKNLQRVEIMISYNGTLFRSERADETFQNALDQCIEVLEGQIRRNKTRLEKRLREGAFTNPNYDREFPLEVEEEPEFNIRVKNFPIKPMTPEEAILQMNLLGHSFYVFENSDTGKINVVYVRYDESYGLIAQS